MKPLLVQVFTNNHKEKFENIFNSNPGLEPFFTFIYGLWSEMLRNTQIHMLQVTISVDVEQYSAYEDRRHSLSTENLEQYLIIYVYDNIKMYSLENNNT